MNTRMTFRHRLLVSVATMGMVYCIPEIASAAEADSGIQEIVVTAQKREQKITDVGATIAVQTGADLKSLGVTDVSQLAAAVPGFTSGVSQTGAPLFALRGINFNATQFSAAPAVSVYVSEVALPYSFMTEYAFLDVDHIEVVKGPQGTLFGENATGGSINVIPKRPTDKLSAGTEFTYNNFGELQNESFVSGPLTDKLKARLAVATQQFGAWQKPYFLGKDKNGDKDKTYGRLLADWTPTDRLTVSVNLNAGYDHSQFQQPQFRTASPQIPAFVNPGFLTYPQAKNGRDADFDPGFNTRVKNLQYQGALRIDYQLTDHTKLTSITNYVKSQYQVPMDIDGTAIPGVQVLTRGKDDAISQELRLSGDAFDKRLNYIIGGNYENNSLAEKVDQNFFSYSGLPVPGVVFTNPFHLSARYLGFFGNFDYKLTPEVTLTGGMRYTEARETEVGCSRDGGNGVLAAVIPAFLGLPPALASAYKPGGCLTVDTVGGTLLPVSFDQKQDEHNLSWRGGVNYQPTPDALIYAIISKGYKAGIWLVNTFVTNDSQVPVVQEALLSYETGAKLSFFERRLQVNGALFYYDYTNKQFSTFIPTPLGGALVLKNIPKSKAYGLDLDVEARPIPELTLRGSLTYIRTRVGPFIGFDHITLQPVQFEGSQFSFAPTVSATFGADYRVPVTDDIAVSFGGGGTYTARTWADLGQASGNILPHHLLLDLRAGVESTQGWRASIWVHNLTDKFYTTSTTPGGDVQAQLAGLPRTYGFTVGYQF